MVPDPNDFVGDLLQTPRDMNYVLHLRGSPEQTRAVILAEAETAETEAWEWTTW
jgi:hypothetical protein